MPRAREKKQIRKASGKEVKPRTRHDWSLCGDSPRKSQKSSQIKSQKTNYKIHIVGFTRFQLCLLLLEVGWRRANKLLVLLNWWLLILLQCSCKSLQIHEVFCNPFELAGDWPKWKRAENRSGGTRNAKPLCTLSRSTVGTRDQMGQNKSKQDTHTQTQTETHRNT